MTNFVTQSEPFGSVPQVPNEFATADLDTKLLIDPQKIVAFKESIADQMNAQSPGPTFKDLSERIAGVTLETTAQGASILTVGVIDPLWVLLIVPDANGNTFIQTDAQGYLWPPIDVNFPTGTDMVWRLAQVDANWDAQMDMQNGNITLTFEDRIASLLREMSPAIPGGLSQGEPNQSLGGFFQQLVDNANSVLHLKKGERIRLVEMISPQDPNYTPPITDLPASAQSGLRTDALKNKQGLSAELQKQLNAEILKLTQLVTQGAAEGARISQIEQLPWGKVFFLNPGTPFNRGTLEPYG